jgi:hypothetical protein
MNSPKRQAIDYIDFLAATPKVCSALEAARVQPDPSDSPAHDAFTRLLHRLEPDPETLWQEVAPQVRKTEGFLVLDDSTLDKPYSRQIELVIDATWTASRNSRTIYWRDGSTPIGWWI